MSRVRKYVWYPKKKKIGKGLTPKRHSAYESTPEWAETSLNGHDIAGPYPTEPLCRKAIQLAEDDVLADVEHLGFKRTILETIRRSGKKK